jgi:hypothetical protein
MCEHVALDEQAIDLVLAPAAVEGRGVKLGDRGGVAWRRFRQHGLASREQMAE